MADRSREGGRPDRRDTGSRGGGAGRWAAARAGFQAERANSEAARATRALAAEEASRRDAEAAASRETHARKAVEAANVDLRAAQDRVRAGLYASEMNLLQFAWKEDDLPRVHELLARTTPKPGEPDLRGYEWWYWQHQAHGEVRSLRLPSSARYIAALSGDGSRVAFTTVAAWDVANRAAAHHIRVIDTTTGRELFEHRVPYNSFPSLAFDRGGGDSPPPGLPIRCRAVASSTVGFELELRVWDVSGRREIFSSRPRVP